MGFLATRYRVRFDWEIFSRNGFLAGNDDRRLAELNAALRDREPAAILAARGGYGLNRIAHAADWGALRRRPKWIVGFSDATAMHVEAARVGVASVHGANVAGLGRAWAPHRSEWVAALEQPSTPRRFGPLDVWVSGRARGVLFGGNLTLLQTCLAAGRLRVPPSAILVLEDVSEAPYRLDRMLVSMRVAGALDGVAGVAVGEMTHCFPGRHGVPAESVLREALEPLGVPVVAGLPVGHGFANATLPFGLEAVIDQGHLTVCPRT